MIGFAAGSRQIVRVRPRPSALLRLRQNQKQSSKLLLLLFLLSLLIFIPRTSRHHKTRLGCRPNAGDAQWSERHGCRESAARTWMSVRRGPTERRRSAGTRRSRAKPGARTLGYLVSFQVTRRRRNSSAVRTNSRVYGYVPVLKYKLSVTASAAKKRHPPCRLPPYQRKSLAAFLASPLPITSETPGIRVFLKVARRLLSLCHEHLVNR